MATTIYMDAGKVHPLYYQGLLRQRHCHIVMAATWLGPACPPGWVWFVALPGHPAVGWRRELEPIYTSPYILPYIVSHIYMVWGRVRVCLERRERVMSVFSLILCLRERRFPPPGSCPYMILLLLGYIILLLLFSYAYYYHIITCHIITWCLFYHTIITHYYYYYYY